MTPQNLLVYRSKNDLVKAAALLAAGVVREILQYQDTCTFSLAGGTTPGPAYRMLVNAEIVGLLPLERIEILFGDERCVPADDPDSNFKMAQDAFGEGFARFKKVHRIQGEIEPSEAAARYEAALQSPIDIQLLGMGPDTHIASIFPGSAAFAAPGAKAVPVQCPKPPPRRITVTPDVIKSARHTFVLATGAEKAAALFDVFTKPYDPVQRPAQLVLNATWLVDEAAASALDLQ